MQDFGVIDYYRQGLVPYSPYVADNRMYNASAVSFSAGNLARGGGLTGSSDSKLWAISVWGKKNTDGVTYRVFNGNTALGGGVATVRTRFAFDSDGRFQFLGFNSAGTEILNILTSSTALTVASSWVNILASVDMANSSNRHIYVNDVSDLATVTTYTNDTIDFTYADWGVGGQPNSSGLLDGAMADVWFAPGVYIDFSVTANRRLFIDAQGRPVSLGPTGAIPLGTPPLSYTRGPASLAATNFGTGGSYTVLGSLANNSPGPSR